MKRKLKRKPDPRPHPEYRTWKALKLEVEGCWRCPLATDMKIFGDGNTNAELVFVGEGPGKDEVRLGIPFVGKAGKTFDEILEHVPLVRSRFFITNAVRCRATKLDGNRIADRTPRWPELDQCSPFLEATLRFIAPRIIVALGECAVQTLLHDYPRVRQIGIGMWRKTLVRREKLIHKGTGARVIPTWHPSYVNRMKSTQLFQDSVKDIRRAKKLLEAR